MNLTVAYNFLPKQRSLRASLVMDHFGIGFETGKHVVAEGLELPVRAGDVVLFTGASGSGKSSLLRFAAQELTKASGAASARRGKSRDVQGLHELTPHGSPLIDIDALKLPDDILVEAIDLAIPETLALLSCCGLGEAHLLLRTPAELSDGQRYRFRLALAVSRKPRWIVADEFTATLDRTLAKVVAFNIRRTADRTGTGFLLATTHEDVGVDLTPDVHVRCRLDGEVHVESRSKSGKRKAESGDALQATSSGSPLSAVRFATKGETTCPTAHRAQSPSPRTSTSPPDRNATGRISLGGITAATTSGS